MVRDKSRHSVVIINVGLFLHFVYSQVFNSGCPCVIIFIYDFSAFQTSQFCIHISSSELKYCVGKAKQNYAHSKKRVLLYDRNV